MRRLGLCVMGLLLSGCAGGPDQLYEDGEPRRLRDGSVVLTTSWHAGSEDSVDIRRIHSRGGTIRCELVSPRRGHWIGDVSEDAWVTLWRRLLAAKPFDQGGYDVEQDDPSGGPYHILRFDLGQRTGRFSAQLKRNVLIFSSKDVHERMAYVTLIVDLVAAHATSKIEDPKSKTPNTP